MFLTKRKLNNLFRKAENDLLDTNNRYLYNRDNVNSFPSNGGVYAIFLLDELIYIGETADLKARMKDLRNTYNHTFRKKMGLCIFDTPQIVNNKFTDEIEAHLDLIFRKCIDIAFINVNFGRTEIENYLVQKYPNLLNSNAVRGN